MGKLCLRPACNCAIRNRIVNSKPNCTIQNQCNSKTNQTVLLEGNSNPHSFSLFFSIPALPLFSEIFATHSSLILFPCPLPSPHHCSQLAVTKPNKSWQTQTIPDTTTKYQVSGGACPLHQTCFTSWHVWLPPQHPNPSKGACCSRRRQPAGKRTAPKVNQKPKRIAHLPPRPLLTLLEQIRSKSPHWLRFCSNN